MSSIAITTCCLTVSGHVERRQPRWCALVTCYAPARIAAHSATRQDLRAAVDEAKNGDQQQRTGAQPQHEKADRKLPHALAPGAQGVRGVQRQPGAVQGRWGVVCAEVTPQTSMTVPERDRVVDTQAHADSARRITRQCMHSMRVRT